MGCEFNNPFAGIILLKYYNNIVLIFSFSVPWIEADNTWFSNVRGRGRVPARFWLTLEHVV